MKITKLFKLLIFYLLLVSSVYAQKNLKKAYYYNTDGKKIEGFINYRKWNKSPETIDFYKTEESKAEKINIFNSTGFTVAGETYEVKDIEFIKSERNVKTMEIGEHHDPYKLRGFCQVLVKNETSLYKYVDELALNHYFIDNKEYKMYELIYTRILKSGRNYSRRVVENNKYKGQLIVITSDCESLNQSIKKSEYNDKDLTNIIESYNQCLGYEVEKVENNKGKIVSFGILAGFSQANINIPESKFTFMGMAEFNHSNSPVIGFNITLENERGMGKWVLNTDVLYRSQSFTGVLNQYNSENSYDIYDYKIGGHFIQINFNPRYYFLNKGVKPYLSVGLYASLAVSNTNEKVHTHYFYGSETIKYSIANETYGPFSVGFLSEFGISYKKFNLGLRYNLGSAYGPYVTTSEINLLLYYTF